MSWPRRQRRRVWGRQRMGWAIRTACGDAGDARAVRTPAGGGPPSRPAFAAGSLAPLAAAAPVVGFSGQPPDERLSVRPFHAAVCVCHPGCARFVIRGESWVGMHHHPAEWTFSRTQTGEAICMVVMLPPPLRQCRWSVGRGGSAPCDRGAHEGWYDA